MFDIILGVIIAVSAVTFSAISYFHKDEFKEKYSFVKKYLASGSLATLFLVITGLGTCTKFFRDHVTINKQRQIIIQKETMINMLNEKIQNYETNISKQNNKIESMLDNSIQNQNEMIENVLTLIKIQGGKPLLASQFKGIWRLREEKGSVLNWGKDVLRKTNETFGNTFVYWEFGQNLKLTRYKVVDGKRIDFENDTKFGGSYKVKNGMLFIGNQLVEFSFEKNGTTLNINYDDGNKVLEKISKTLEYATSSR